MIPHAGPSRSKLPMIKVVSGIEAVLVYMEKEAALQYILNLIGSSLQKREVSGRVTSENYKLCCLFPLC